MNASDSTTVTVEPGRSITLLSVLCFAERAGYYGLRFPIVVLMLQAFAYGEASAVAALAAFSALSYLAYSVVGIVVDRFIRVDRGALVGLALLPLGYLATALAIPSRPAEPGFLLPLGWAICIVGSALYRVSGLALINAARPEAGGKRDAAFVLYYWAENLGAITATVMTAVMVPWLGWRAAMLAIGIITLLGFAAGVVKRQMLRLQPQSIRRDRTSVFGAAFVLVAAVAVVTALLATRVGVTPFLFGTYIVAHAYLFIMMRRQLADGTKQFFLLMAATAVLIIYYVIYEQQFSSVMLFITRQVDLVLFGLELFPTIFQSINPIAILIVTPLVAMWRLRQARRHDGKSHPTLSFATGFGLVSLSVLVLLIGSSLASPSGKVAAGWVALTFALMAIAEIFIQPAVFSIATRILPQSMIGVSTGIWSLNFGVSLFIGASVAKLVAFDPEQVTIGQQALDVYVDFFVLLLMFTLACTAVQLLTYRARKWLGARRVRYSTRSSTENTVA